MSDKHKVRLTIRPEVEIEVGGPEYLDLLRQGLIVKSQATTPEGLRRAAVKQVEVQNTPGAVKSGNDS